MKRRSFLAALFGAPVVAAVPAFAVPAPVDSAEVFGIPAVSLSLTGASYGPADIEGLVDQINRHIKDGGTPIYDESGYILGRAY